MGKRANKGTLQKRFRAYLRGPGGLKCPCCGARHNAGRIERRQSKESLNTRKREMNAYPSPA